MPVIPLDRLDLDQVIQGWETAKAGRGVSGSPMQIAGRAYEHGVGTHTVSSMDIRLDGGGRRFEAEVGIDDKVGSKGLGAARFRIAVDGAWVADSGVRRGGEEPLPMQADLQGASLLRLVVEAPDDVTHHGHANWAAAQIVFEGPEPRLVAPERGEPPAPLPPPGPEPRFLFQPSLGARPGRPVLHRLALLGAEDTVVECDGLPGELHLDPATAVISGVAPAAGCWSLPLRAHNAHGECRAVLQLRVGEQCLAPTPPMGWCSWNGYGAGVTQQDIAANHRALLELGLHRYGYQRVNIDDGWQGARFADTTIPWALQPNDGFPDIPGLAADIHASGLLAGIYSVPGLYSPQGLMGGSGEHPDGSSDTSFVHGESKPIGEHIFFHQDVAQWAAWGMDWVKIDNCPPAWVIREMVRAQQACGRDIAIALSAKMPRETLADHRGLAQQWRTTGDLIDTWPSVRNKLWAQLEYLGQGGPGGWNDCDMLVVGEVGPGWNGPRRPSRLSWREQALHVGMWSFLASPLLIGCDLTRLDATTRDLLTRPGLIALNQDPLGAPAMPRSLDRERGLMQWTRPLADGDLAVALVNTGDESASMHCDATALGRDPDHEVIDCWDETPVEHDRCRLEAEVPAHGHRIFRLRAGS